ncbi:hypothetical protein AB0K60_01675 [Thermopolyspora sp. NPDC052614]|uniref:hypothetical protein n=1 Tax=Thermopolyspora sp. NPDC052614 TaxID=3155682 RepID=UPI003445A2B4
MASVQALPGLAGLEGLSPGWWLIAVVVAGQLVAELPRRWVERNLAEARRKRRAAIEARRRLRGRRAVPLTERERTELRDDMLERRGEARRARLRGAAGWTVLALTWIAAQFAVLHWKVNASALPFGDHDAVFLGAAAAMALCGLALWWALDRAGDEAAFDRAVAQVAYQVVAGLAIYLTVRLGATGVLSSQVVGEVSPPTTASALLITLSPLLRRILVTLVRPARRPAAEARNADGQAAPSQPLTPPGRKRPQTTGNPDSSMPPPEPTGQPDDPAARTMNEHAARPDGPTRPFRRPTVPPESPPEPAVQAHGPTKPLKHLKHPTAPADRPVTSPRAAFTEPPTAPPRPLPTLLLSTLTLGKPLRRGTQHVLYATVPGSDEQVVFKRFTAPGAMVERNPVRPLDAYRELLSRANGLSLAERALLDRLTLWPHAIVADQGRAVGVLYRTLTPPFLLTRGGAQTGDHLHADDPAHSGCQVVTPLQRGQLLLDVIRAHELLHDLGLAHGDTCWKNFVYGVQDGRGRGQLIDIDGVTSVDDPNPLLLHQPDWDVEGTPVERDRRRIALLVARLASPEVRYDARSVPADGLPWFTPLVRRLTEESLAAPAARTTLRLRQALEDALL